MEKIKLQELKNRLFELKKLYLKSELEKDKKNSSTKSEIIYFTNSLIEDFNLTEYDKGIKMESHKTKFFITDVERIIFEEEK